MRLKTLILILLVSFQLSGCATITRKIQTAANAEVASYPAATSRNNELDRPLVVDLSQYKSTESRHRHHRLTIAFAASGGGYRAANLTLGVLMGMEQRHSARLRSNLLQSIDYFSTVSGGGFGVGYYMAQLHNYFVANPNDAEPDFFLTHNVNQLIDDDDLHANPLRVDLTHMLFFGETRGGRLEENFNQSLLATPEGGLKLGDIFVPKNAAEPARLPYWVTNATVFQNAVIFPFSPDILKRYRVTDYFHNQQLTPLQGTYLDTRYGYDVPVSVGLTASASVPFAIPSTTLTSAGCGDDDCYLQLMDGGLSDNLGVYTALSFLLQDKSKIKVLVIADAYKGTVEPYSQLMNPPSSIPLVWRLLTVTTDANREHIKPNIRVVARDLLCHKGASNVIVIYLDLGRYPKAQRIGTQLSLTRAQQKMLLQVGQELVQNDPQIKELLLELDKGHVTLGRCNQS